MPHNPQPLTPELLRIYHQTDYTVMTPYPFIMHIGQPCTFMAPLFEEYGSSSAVLITAANPFCHLFGKGVNSERNARLQAHLDGAGIRWVAALAEGRGAHWPTEAGFLVFGVSRKQARQLMVEFEQNIAVWVDADAIPQLMQHPEGRAVMTPPGA